MAEAKRVISLTRPREPEKEGASSPWQYTAGLALALTGLLSLAVLFVTSAVVAGWVSDISDPSEANPAKLAARVATYKAWLSPVAMAYVAMTMVGIAVVLLGVVRRLWVQMAVMKQALPALARGGKTS